MKIVLQKYISMSGYCSRRRAQELISGGYVKVNGKSAELGMKAGEDDEVTIDGKKISPESKKIFIILNKPLGYASTARKFKGEKSLFELVDIDERLFIAGRLDKNSTGLVILTNDGDAAYELTHPKFEHEKEYVVKISNFQFPISNEIANSIIKKLISGVEIGEGDGVVSAKKIEYFGKNKFRIILTEGKKRQIRRMFKVLGYEVEDLKRVRIGNIVLGNLKEGNWKELSIKFIKL
jgi:23S rRNA pseudouridine2604 synthase